MPPRSAVADWTSFLEYVRSNNNVTWRNFNVVDVQAMVANPSPLQFLIAGAPERDVEMGLEVIAYLPAEARLFLEAPPDLLDRFDKFELRPLGRQDLGVAEFPADLRADARLHVELPEEAAKRSGWTVAIRQYATPDRLEVGRVTWYFAAPELFDRTPVSAA